MNKEFELLKKCLKPVESENVIVGPGDDCSVIPYDEKHYQIATTDCLVEGVHFIKNQISIEQLAHKILAVNISDISAMGGKPYWCHLSLILPQSFSQEESKTFFDSFYQVAAEYNISLIGGNLSSTNENMIVQVHMTGLVEKENLQLRSDFKKSQLLCVTQYLGDSAAGLHSLANKKNDELILKHFKPVIEIEKAYWLASQKSVHGMMDLSDGLISDLEHIPDVELNLHLEKIPHSSQILKYCEKSNLDPFSFSLAGGEDYSLLFGCDQESVLQLKQNYQKEFNSDFYIIGEIQQGRKKTNWLKDNQPIKLKYKSFKHFKD